MDANTDLLIIGGSGFVGAHLVQAALAAGLRVAYTYKTRPLDLDAPGYPVDFLSAAPDLEDCLAAARPRAVIHSAVSYPNQPEAHAAISQHSVERITRWLREQGSAARLVYVSTNAVFTGWTERAYREDDPPGARDDRYRDYGHYRRLGEQAALAGLPGGAIVARTAHVEGRFLNGPLHWRLEEIAAPLRAGQALARFTDRTISPTRVETLAAALLELAAPACSWRGVLHVAGRQTLTDFEYARCIARRLGCDPDLVQPSRYRPAGETRTYNLALDSGLAQRTLATRLEAVDEMLAKIPFD